MVQRNNRTNLGLLLGRKNRLLSVARYISGAQKYKRIWPQAAKTTIVIFDGAATETKRTRDARGAAVFRTFCIAEKLWQTNRRSRQTYRTAKYVSIPSRSACAFWSLEGFAGFDQERGRCRGSNDSAVDARAGRRFRRERPPAGAGHQTPAGRGRAVRLSLLQVGRRGREVPQEEECRP